MGSHEAFPLSRPAEVQEVISGTLTQPLWTTCRAVPCQHDNTFRNPHYVCGRRGAGVGHLPDPDAKSNSTSHRGGSGDLYGRVLPRTSRPDRQRWTTRVGPMRWRFGKTAERQVGDHQIAIRFLLWPRQLDGEWRWLELAGILQRWDRFHVVSESGGFDAVGWRNVDWVW
jgi:hypothetical protein